MQTGAAVSAPVRIWRRRTKGWRMPANTVSVDRKTKWGNPFRLDLPDTSTFHVKSVAEAVEAYRNMLPSTYLARDLPELRGKNLACWCKPDAPCHADVLLELANPPAAITLAPLPERKLNISPAFDAALARAPRSGWNKRR
jgi:hypothetical protein